MKKKLNYKLLLLTPSWLSGLVCLTIAMAMVIATVIMSNLRSAGLEHSIFSAQGLALGTNLNYQTIATNLSQYPVINYLPLYIFWVGTGAIVYFLTMHLLRVFNDALAIKRELMYVHAERRSLIRQALLHLAVRLAALVAWILFIVFTLDRVLPYCLLEAHKAAATLSAHNFFTAIYAMALLALDFFVQTIFLRLLFLRTRLFGEEIYN